MREAEIRSIIYLSFSRPKILFWFVVRVISTAGPLLTTYLFARIVDALERHQSFQAFLIIATSLLLTQVLSNLLRIGSKTRLEIEIGKMRFDLQNALLNKYKQQFNLSKEVIQAVINTAKATEDFFTYVKESGINGIIHFFAVPVLLFFIDKRIFAIEIFLIIFYLGFNLFISRKYERRFEAYDKSKEMYYSHVFEANNFMGQSAAIFKSIKGVGDMVFFMWEVLQNLIAGFQYVVLILIGSDILSGVKRVADLVLVVGYTQESQGFLNNITTISELYMEVKAGIKRLALLLPVFPWSP